MNTRPSICYAQIPHSVLDRVQTIKNPTAKALLTLIARRTLGFGRGYVDVTYRALSAQLKVGTRAIARAAQLLVDCGDLIRERRLDQSYRWRVPLKKSEIIADPKGTLTVRSQPEEEGGVMIDRSCPPGSIDHAPHDRSIMTSSSPASAAIPDQMGPQAPSKGAKNDALKKRFKEHDLKKQHHGAPSNPVPAPSDDEPRHKYLLRSLIKSGVSRRKARQLCRDCDHDLIESVLKKVPTLDGIKNIPGYIVAEITDGGYDTEKKTKKISGELSHPENYAHLTKNKIAGNRHKNVKPLSDAPKISPSVEQTRTEQQALEAEKRKQEQEYEKKSRQLSSRFKELAEDLQLRLKLIASIHLSKLVPVSEKREMMLKDKTFRRMANRTVTERFFEWVDQGLDELQALQRLEGKFAV